MVTEPVTRLLASWAGLRSFLPDRAPALGRDPGNPSFFWVAGQGGYGFQTAPGMATAAAALATGRPLPPGLAALGVTEAALSPARVAA
jgi:glycine/D-amino acid oxidase-like deaminating enzyme